MDQWRPAGVVTRLGKRFPPLFLGLMGVLTVLAAGLCLPIWRVPDYGTPGRVVAVGGVSVWKQESRFDFFPELCDRIELLLIYQPQQRWYAELCVYGLENVPPAAGLVLAMALVGRLVNRWAVGLKSVSPRP